MILGTGFMAIILSLVFKEKEDCLQVKLKPTLMLKMALFKILNSYGDFGVKDVSELSDMLKGVVYDKLSIAKSINSNIMNYFWASVIKKLLIS